MSLCCARASGRSAALVCCRLGCVRNVACDWCRCCPFRVARLPCAIPASVSVPRCGCHVCSRLAAPAACAVVYVPSVGRLACASACSPTMRSVWIGVSYGSPGGPLGDGMGALACVCVADPVHTTCVVVNSVCGGATVSNDHLQQMVMCVKCTSQDTVCSYRLPRGLYIRTARILVRFEDSTCPVTY